MNDKPDNELPAHFILLTRAGDEGTREYQAWDAELPTLFGGTVVGFGNIADAVDDARAAAVAGKSYDLDLNVRVTPGTSLSGDDVLALIEANGGPKGLDLSQCKMAAIDLSVQAITKARHHYLEAKGSEPPWIPDWELVEEKPVCLVGARLQGVDLSDARLAGADMMSADLTDARLVRADLSQALLNFASIRGACFDDAKLRQAQLEGTDARGASFFRASLQAAEFQFADLSGANFDEALLDGAAFAWAELAGARMMAAQVKKANFYGAHFRDNFLLETDFEGADFTLARLEQVDLYRAASLLGARWTDSFLDRTRLRRHQIGPRIGDELEAHHKQTQDDYHRASEAYLLLKNNFLTLGRYDDAAWTYIKEQQMQKMAYHWQWRAHGWRIWRVSGSFWRWLRNWAYELLTGYGERPINPVLGGAVALVAFTLGYFFTGAINNLFDAVVYSLATFATFNLVDLQPHGRGVDIASSFEALLGIAVLALFIFTLGNRMSRS